MKLSIVLSTQPSGFDALAYKGDLERNAARIARLGYDGVELHVRDPSLLDAGHVLEVLQEAGLEAPAIGTGQVYADEGLSFSHPDSTVRRQTVERIAAHIGLARALHSLVIIGLVRGRTLTGVEPAMAWRWVTECLAECAHRAAPDVRLVLEPINRYETDLANTVGEALELVQGVGAASIGLLFDTFHANIEEVSIAEAIRASAPRLWHVHVADSNRWYPGAGHTDFAAIIATLREVAYDGWLSAEILPLPDATTCADRAIANLRAVLSPR